MGRAGGIAARLLRWYDAHARALPWRERPGQMPGQMPRENRADPYRVWLSEVMLQQTTVAAVIPYFERFTQRWPTVAALAAADEGEVMAAWAGLGYYARARNLVACAKAVAVMGGVFPDSEEALHALPGLGAYTAAAVAAIAFGQRAVVVDANVERCPAFRHRHAMAWRKGGDSCGHRYSDARSACRRFRAGDDGSGRHGMHSAGAGLSCLPFGEGLRRPCAG